MSYHLPGIRRLLFPRRNPGTARLAAWLEARGYEIEYFDLRGLKLRQFIEAGPPPETLIFLWAGGWRKINADKWQRRPGLAYMEQGFLPHYSSMTLDAAGHCASSIITQQPILEPSGNYRDELAAFLEVFAGPRHGKAARNVYEVPGDGPFVLFPMQSLSDSVMNFDALPGYRRHGPLIERICETLPAGWRLVVKQHPLHNQQVHYPRNLPVHMIPAQASAEGNEWLLRNAAAMIAVNSSFVLEALAVGLPVIALGRGVWTPVHDQGGPPFLLQSPRLARVMWDQIPVNRPAADRFLHHLVTRRQILYDAHSLPPHDIRHCWETFCSDYRRLWHGAK